jgi:Fic family protein
MRQARPVVQGKYLHWDNLRHRGPPEGLSHEAWWLGIKLSRLAAREPMPLLDEKGQPFSLVYVPPIRQAVHHVDQNLGATGPSSAPGRVEGLVEAHGRRHLLASSLIEEAIRSSQLEGASTTRARAKDMIRARRPPKDRSEHMILNNFMAMERIAELAGSALTLDAILELHSILTEGTLDDPKNAGVLRTEDDHVVVELLHSIESAHVPPPAHELPERMERVLAFANGDTPEEWLHPVLRSIIVHFMIGYEHPFMDGNGRVARALFYWAMLRRGYSLAKFLSISSVLREAPVQYARAYLYTETDGGDLTYFVDHQLRAIAKSIDALGAYVTRKAEETRQIEAELRDSSLNHRQVRLLGHALRHPGFEYTVRSHETSHGVVTNTARADLEELAGMGILLKSKVGRRHVYVAPRDLEERLRRRQRIGSTANGPLRA